MPNSKDWLPLTQAAQQLGLSWEATWRRMLRRELTGVKHGGRWMVRRADVRRLARARRRQLQATA